MPWFPAPTVHWLVQHRLPEAAGNSSAAAVALYPSQPRLVRVLGEAFRITSASLLVAEPAQCRGCAQMPWGECAKERRHQQLKQNRVGSPLLMLQQPCSEENGIVLMLRYCTEILSSVCAVRSCMCVFMAEKWSSSATTSS